MSIASKTMDNVALVLAAMQPAVAQHCLRMVVTASGSSSMWTDEDVARKSAIAVWNAAARTQAGSDYASWEAAASKKLNCGIVTKSMVRCTAAATPCK
ncbi:hypothetical protein [Bradyrhizobium sp. WD16]|uniref:hypothetical protein n=1 Tax=Bradyrhizobium sp. WD16 TaxID=1521768 RepID=UPI0020A2DDD0|nr:hypothetical protein [Bradyrhizobium sp. WD16]